MYRFLTVIAATCLAVSPVAAAETIFAAHRGPPLVMHGDGGTKITRHGVDVWTSGMPARPFQVIGSIGDERTDKVWDGDALASRAIADKVHQVGGDAVLLGSRSAAVLERRSGGGGGIFGTPSFSSQGPMVVHDVATRLVVIKYLNE